jgi:hypothetical protein
MFVLKGGKELALFLLRSTKSKNGIIVSVIQLNLMKYITPLFLLGLIYLGDFNRPVLILLCD